MCIALPAKVLSVTNPARKMIAVECFGQTRTVSAAAILSSDQTAAELIGQWVVLHQGFAMDRITAADAAEIIAALDGLSDPDKVTEVSGFRARQSARGMRS